MVKPTRLQLLHGRDEPPAELRELRAGPVRAKLDGVDLRYVQLGSTELVRRLYVAVRDESWGTVPAKISNLELEESQDSFTLTFDARHESSEIAFGWRGTISGRPDGTITARMAGRAAADFAYNRIGFCVLHPPSENAGRHYRAETPDGPIDGTLPDLIAPQAVEDGLLVPVFPSYTDLTIELENGELRFELEGDLFEMEDQRNWIDGSFKTYSTPLALGFPHAARAGQEIEQSVTISLTGATAPPRDVTAGPVLTLGAGTGRELPQLGLGVASDGVPLGEREINALRRLRLDHLRVDVHLADASYPTALAQALEEASALDCAVELAVVADEGDGDELEALAERLEGARVARVLVFGRDAGTNTPEETAAGSLVEHVREKLAPTLPGVPFVGGTDMYFCNLNRTRPELDAMDGVYWSMNPQVHAFDDQSIMETCEPQADTVRTARSFSGELPLIVSAVTLLPRWNPYVVGPAPTLKPGQLPPEVDPRQASQLAAAWTLGSIKYLAEAGIASATYYETTGWRGVLERASGSPEPEAFPSVPGEPFPVYGVFADLARLREAELVMCQSSDPLVAIGLVLRHGEATTILVANMTPKPQLVEIEGGPRVELDGYAVETCRVDSTGS